MACSVLDHLLFHTLELKIYIRKPITYIIQFKHACVQGLRTPNQDINQRYLKSLDNVADKICFSRI